MMTTGLIFIALGVGILVAVTFGGRKRIKRKRTDRAIHSVRRAYPHLQPDDKQFDREVKNLLRRKLR